MTIKASKVRLRRATTQRVAAIPLVERLAQEKRLVDRLSDLPGFANARVVLMHVTAFEDEVPTGLMLQRVLAAGKRLVCPRIDLANRRLELFEVTDLANDLRPGFRAIREPVEGCRPVESTAVDWALVPGIAFDPLGFRLGRGGGYYDRLLPTLRPDAACWALIFAEQWVAEVPREPHDRPLDGVADHRTTRLGARSRPLRGE